MSLFSCADMQFVKTFLLSYQSFTTPLRLLGKLVERYNVVRPEGMSLKKFHTFRITIQVRKRTESVDAL